MGLPSVAVAGVAAAADGTEPSAAVFSGAVRSAGMTIACRIAMGATMAFMLLIMV